MADKETTTAEEEAPTRTRAKRSSSCPNCGGELIPHEGTDNPFKVGAEHCNACGGCFIDGKQR